MSEAGQREPRFLILFFLGWGGVLVLQSVLSDLTNKQLDSE